MSVDTSRLTDEVHASVTRGRTPADRGWITGHGVAVVRDAAGQVTQEVEFTNLVTQVGDQYYGDAGAALNANATVTAPDPVTGMRLGDDNTAVAKTGAGAAIVSYVSGSNNAIDAGYPTSALNGAARRITWRTTWAAGDATANGIAEVVITNEVGLTDVAGSAANTISRALLSPVVNKAAGDSLQITWHHDTTGA